jgi:hypothetical protein
MNSITIKYISIFVLAVYCTAIHADLKTDIGYRDLQAELNAQGKALPDGGGVQVLMAEACGNSVDDDNDPETPPICLAWLPHISNSQFQDKTLNDLSFSSPGFFSGHATTVASLFFGNSSAIADGIDTIDIYFADHWLEEGYLQATNPSLLPTISSNRIGNHSWVGTVGSEPEEQLIDSEILRRVDWLIDRDEFIQVVGLTNGSENPALLGSAFNVIAVGRSDGEHGQGSAAVDTSYQVGRTRPDLVAPLSTTSSATPVIASAAALLVETGHNEVSLSTDLQIISTTNRAGDAIYNAERSEVIKAILMAGADRNASDNDITNYRSTTSTQTNNGLDSRFGAGQINIANSYHILAAGEQNSSEDIPNGTGTIEPTGFDYDPVFGGVSASNTEASYTFSTGSEAESLYVSLVWNIKINEGQNGEFDGTALLHDLNLNLFDVTENPTLIASSSSDNENTENLWVALNSNRDYVLKVVAAANQTAFKWDYAIAWRRQADTDHDGIANNKDNCILIANANQLDSNSDGFGNICDADLDSNGLVSFADINLFRARFGTTDPDADFNGSGSVSFGDLDIFRSLFGQPPGPAGEL